jgi:hypothetical protein
MDWRESKAHRAALYRLASRIYGELKADPLADYWDAKLGEPRQQAVQRWFDEGYYRLCSPLETLALTLTVAALKTMLKERGLKVSGKKSDLLDRLNTADPDVLETFAHDHPVWLLTDEALRMRDEFRSEETQEEALARQEVGKLLEAGEIEGACKVWQCYDAEKVFSAAEGMIGFSGSADVAASRYADIERFFAIGPRETAIELAMETLFGRGPASRETRLLNTGAAFARDMGQWRDADYVIGVEIKRSPTGGCDACTDIVGCWPKDRVPAVPNKRCGNEDGCLCWWTAIFKGEAPASPWRA